MLLHSLQYSDKWKTKFVLSSVTTGRKSYRLSCLPDSLRAMPVYLAFLSSEISCCISCGQKRQVVHLVELIKSIKYSFSKKPMALP